MKSNTTGRGRSILAHTVLIILSFMCLFFFYILFINQIGAVASDKIFARFFLNLFHCSEKFNAFIFHMYNQYCLYHWLSDSIHIHSNLPDIHEMNHSSMKDYKYTHRRQWHEKGCSLRNARIKFIRKIRNSLVCITAFCKMFHVVIFWNTI